MAKAISNGYRLLVAANAFARSRIVTHSNATFIFDKKPFYVKLTVFFLAGTIRRKISSGYILLTVQISWSGCLYFMRYRAISVLQLFVNQVEKS